MGFAVLHLGDHNIIGGVRDYMGDDAFSLMREEIEQSFGRSDIPEIIRLMDTHFETHNYSLWHLFKDEQRKVLDQILDATLKEVEASFRQIYERHYPVMQVMKEMRIPLPKAFATATELIVNTDLCEELKREELDFEQIQRLAEEAKRWSLELDTKSLGFVAAKRINSAMERLSEYPGEIAVLKMIENTFIVLRALPLELDLSKAQNIYFSLGKTHYDTMKQKAAEGDHAAKEWIEHFGTLGNNLHVKCP
jgi:hypothetical protein